MPIYEYQCKKCKHRFEKIKKVSDKPEKKCPDCGGPVERLLHAPAVQFKGSGWYATDYAKSGSKNESKSPDSASSSSEKGESKSAEKSESNSGKSDKSDKDPAKKK